MFSGWSYSKKVTTIIMCCVLVPCLIILGIYVNLKINDIFQRQELEASTIIDTVSENTFKVSDGVYQKVKFITYYNDLNEVLSTDEKIYITSETLVKNRNVNDILSAMFYDISYTDYCIYTTNKNACVLGVIRYVDYETFSAFDDSPAGVWVMEEQETEKVVSYYKKYSLVGDNYNVIKISYPLNAFLGSFSGLSHDDVYIRLNMSGCDDLVMKYDMAKDSFVFAESADGDFYEKSSKITPIGLDIDVLMKKQNVSSELALLIICLLFLLSAVGICIYIVSNLISKKLMKSVEDVVDGIKLNDMSIIEKSPNSVEMDIIKGHLFELRKQLADENEKKLEFETRMLAERISPHFLYNNLSAIKSSCMGQKPRQAIDMLIRYYRNVFQKGANFTTVKLEVENGVEYLRLLQFSYEVELDIDIRIAPETVEKTIPSNVLQPVLENAFIHGVNDMPEDKKGYITIEVYTDEEALIVAVTDNGGNFNKENYERKMKEPDINSALKVLIKRMELMYNDSKYTLSISGDENKTTAILRFRSEGWL